MVMRTNSFERKITDFNYLKVEGKNKALDYTISSVINHLRLKISFDNLNTENVLCLDDNFLVFDVEKENKEDFLVYFLFTLFAFLLSLTILLGYQSYNMIPFFLWSFYFCMTVLLLFQLHFYFNRSKQELIFNRKNGTVTFPDRGRKTNNTMKFSVVNWNAYTRDGKLSGVINLPILIMRSPKTHFYSFRTTIYFDKINASFQDLFLYKHYDVLSLLVWYMDRNRPLPPGVVFDEFRMEDFEHRKEQKFPKPLFNADFETPEATVKQQAERMRISRW